MQTTTQSNPVISYNQVRAPRGKRFNLRLIVFLVVATAPFLLAIGMYVKNIRNQGITQSGGVNIVDLKALGYFPFDQTNGSINEIPRKWRELDGKRVQLEGFMFSGQSAAGQLSDFQFVYNVQKCCFNGPPQVQERVFAHVPKGRSVPYYGDFSRVTGTLHVNVKKDDAGVIVSLYTLDVDSAEVEN